MRCRCIWLLVLLWCYRGVTTEGAAITGRVVVMLLMGLHAEERREDSLATHPQISLPLLETRAGCCL